MAGMSGIIGSSGRPTLLYREMARRKEKNGRVNGGRDRMVNGVERRVAVEEKWQERLRRMVVET